MLEAEANLARRRFLRLMLAVPVLLATGWRLGWLDEAEAADALFAAAEKGGARIPPTPECGDDDEPTPSETEGPFFTPNSPERTSLRETGLAGTPLSLSGRVFTRGCRPVKGALLDFWHAGDDGEYDNEGFKWRGHQFADDQGRFRLETIVPGMYPGRTRHFHVRVQAPKGRLLTTQLYFPGEARNRRDGIFRPDLLLSMNDAPAGKQARFNFVLNVD